MDVYALGINWTSKACNFNGVLDFDLAPWRVLSKILSF